MIRNAQIQIFNQILVVNSFQNFIFKDDSQPSLLRGLTPAVVNSFQNFIFKDDSQQIDLM